MNKVLYACMLIAFGCPVLVEAQDLDQTLKVVKEFDSKLYAVEPIFSFSSVYRSGDQAPTPFHDSLIAIPRTVPDIQLSVKPLSYHRPKNHTLHKGYLMANHGTLNPLAVSGDYVYGRDNYFSAHASFLHDQWSESEAINKKINRTNGLLGFKYYLDQHILTEIDLSGSRESYGLYGFGLESQGESIDQEFGRFDATWRMESFKDQNSAFNFSFAADYHRTSDITYGYREDAWSANAGLQYGINEMATLYIEGEHAQTKEATLYNLNSQSASAGLRFRTMPLAGHIGANYLRIDKKQSWFPDVKLRWDPGKSHSFIIDIGQQLNHLGIRSGLRENPYINFSSLSEAYSFNRRLSGAYSTGMGYLDKISMGITYQISEGAPNYTMKDPFGKTFLRETVDYKSLKVLLFLEKELTDFLHSDIELTYYRYFTTETILLHRPDLIIKPRIAIYVLDARLRLAISGHLRLGLDVQDLQGEIYREAVKKDFSAELRFGLHERISLFLHADNLLNDGFQEWSGYSVFGRNFSAGALVKF